MTGDIRRKRQDGVRSLEDIRDRCRVDEITGCWNWSMAISDNGKAGSSRTPRVWVPAGVLSEGRASWTAPRAAWVLSGRELRPRQGVWRTCCNDACCAPDHLKAGTKKQEGAWMSANGHRRGKPERAAVNLRNVLRMATPREVVLKVESMFAAGVMQKDIKAATGLAQDTLKVIRIGQHVNSSQRQCVVPAASAFTWRPA